ncbi:Trm112 family protein [Oscillochloris sp. ZM17-4]|uniref:Trm112 family protein n=1 Tax=Oscillochloris sp. ZM17-4 TaxID=2866714 RepID=UPI00210440CA|nr:hypothetical protein [Oscillochloris sp. ZM17-4]
MKNLFRIIGVAALIGVGVMVFRALRQYREDSVFDLAPAAGAGGQKRSISPELLSILADPADKGPIELLSDGEGKEWLVNRRNGFRYPVEDGIPIMLLEEGEKNKDESLIQK